MSNDTRTTGVPTDTEITDDEIEPFDDDLPTAPYIRCGCGFEVAGLASDYEMRATFREHDCPDVEYEYHPRPWYSYIFSFWGFVVVGVIVYGLIVILTGGKVS